MVFRGTIRALVLTLAALVACPGCAALGGLQQGVGQLLNGTLGAVDKAAKGLKPTATYKTKRKQASQKAQNELKQSKIKRNYNTVKR